MRTLKFRAWTGKEMIYFDNFKVEDTGGFWGGDREIWQMSATFGRGDCDGFGYFHDDFSQKSDVELMQFTGLLDKNGKEIYEGDIVRCTSFKNLGFTELDWDADKTLFSIDELKGKKEDEYICEIIFDDGEFITEVEKNGTIIPLACFFGEQRNSQPMFFIEIIGNIHENPELL